MAYTQTAKGLSALGRKGDDTLLHVSKKELAGLQSLLGPITVNPNTGLPEAFSWTDLLATAGIGLAGALTGGAALAAAPPSPDPASPAEAPPRFAVQDSGSAESTTWVSSPVSRSPKYMSQKSDCESTR